jgi:hypothetical protein
LAGWEDKRSQGAGLGCNAMQMTAVGEVEMEWKWKAAYIIYNRYKHKHISEFG